MNPELIFAFRVNQIVKQWNNKLMTGDNAMHAIVDAMKTYVKETGE